MRSASLLALLLAPLSVGHLSCASPAGVAVPEDGAFIGPGPLDSASLGLDTGGSPLSVSPRSLTRREQAQFARTSTGSLRARTPLGLRAEVDAFGLVVRSGRDSLALETVAYGSASLGLVPLRAGAPTLHECAPIVRDVARCSAGVARDLGLLTEWWTNSSGGLHQGWTLHAPADDAVLGTHDLVTIEVEVTEGGVVGVDPDGRSATLLGSSGRVWRYAGLSAWDADGVVLPAHLDRDPDTLRVVVDTVGARWPITVDPSLSSEDKNSASDVAARDYFGNPVVFAGDINGDGYAELAVAARYDDDGGVESGSVYLYYGSSTGVAWATEQKLTASNPASYNYFGSLAGGVDFDGDGYGDLAVGSNNHDLYGTNAGLVYVYYGGSTGLVASSEQQIAASDSADSLRFGIELGGVGDVDGDGFDDLAVAGSGGAGAVYIYYGSASGLVAGSEQKITASDGSTNDRFIAISSSRFDLDGDGYDDLVVGAEGDSDDGQGSGSVYVYYGSSTGVLASSETKLTASDAASRTSYGGYVSGAGDLNGDGYDELMVGATADDLTGSVYIYYGSSTGVDSGSEQKINASDASASDRFAVVAGGGDLNADGYDDVLVGAERDNDGRGAVYAYYGSSTGLDASTELKVTASDGAPNDFFGASVAMGGDIDGDGVDDFATGASYHDDHGTSSGSVYVYYGQCASDVDGDGACTDLDCDDSDATVYPRASEVVGDEIDQDCDAAEICYVDADADGYTDGSTTVASVDLDCTDAGEATASVPTGDCDDDDASISPAATEGVGDEVDQDCDGTEICYADADDDGYTDGSTTAASDDTDCTDPGEGTASDPTGDCDDSDASFSPAVAEGVGDEVDQNCDGGEVCYADADDDGQTDGSTTVTSTDTDCTDSGEGTAEDATTDCDDGDADTYAGAPEVVGDEVDQDCDGGEVCFVDADGDGYTDGATTMASVDEDCGDLREATNAATTGDCDDDDPAIHPAGIEAVGDGIDGDCDGLELCYADHDLDGYVDAETTLSSIDLDCEDAGEGDNTTPVGDCDDGDASVHPAATEQPGDEVDQDCDGAELCYADADDDGFPDPYSIVASEDTDCGDAGEGTDRVPLADCDDTDPAIHPEAEELVADGVDQDCDGAERCYADADDDGYIDATSTILSADTDCTDAGEGSAEDATGECDDRNSAVNPGVAERPGDEVDSDCDGTELCYVDADDDGYPDFAQTIGSGDLDCRDAGEGLASEAAGECDDADASVNPGAEEIDGDGIDQDCDGDDPAAPVAEEDSQGKSRGCATVSGAGAPPAWLGLAGLLVLFGRRRRGDGLG